MARETFFVGHQLNAVDSKGRVSVPAAFRTQLERRAQEDGKDAVKELMGGVSDMSQDASGSHTSLPFGYPCSGPCRFAEYLLRSGKRFQESFQKEGAHPSAL